MLSPGRDRFRGAFADRLLHGEPVEILGDGEQARDFTYIADAVGALRRAMRVARISISSLTRCSEVRISIGDPRRAAQRLDFTAQTMLKGGLAMTLDVLGRRPRMKAPAVA